MDRNLLRLPVYLLTMRVRRKQRATYLIHLHITSWPVCLAGGGALGAKGDERVADYLYFLSRYLPPRLPPPSTLITWPVTKDAFSLSRKVISEATSDGVPSLRIGIVDSI